MKTADYIGGGAGIVFGSYVLYEGSRMPADHIMKIGPSFFPEMLAIGLIFFSSLLILYSFFGQAKGHPSPIRLQDKGIQRALLSLVAIVVYALLFIPLGYPLSTFLLVSSIMFLLGVRRIQLIVTVATLTTLTVWLVFARLLMLSMPMGILEPLL
jgi:putative tricarboxylic transport membrane protein